MKHLSIVCQDDLAKTISSLLIDSAVMFSIKPCDANGEDLHTSHSSVKGKYKPIGRHKVKRTDRSIWSVMSFVVKHNAPFRSKDCAPTFLDAGLNPNSASPAISILKRKGYLLHDTFSQTYSLSDTGRALARSWGLIDAKVEPYA